MLRKVNFFKISPATFIKNILKVKINNGLSEKKNQFYKILSIFFLVLLTDIDPIVKPNITLRDKLPKCE